MSLDKGEGERNNDTRIERKKGLYPIRKAIRMRGLILYLFLFPPVFYGFSQEKENSPKEPSIEEKISLCNKRLAELKKSQKQVLSEAIALFTDNPVSSPQCIKKRDVLIDFGPSIAPFLLQQLTLGGEHPNLADHCAEILAGLVKKHQVRSILPNLFELLKAPSKNTRLRVLSILKEYKENSITVQPLVDAYRTEEDPSVKAEILVALASRGVPEAKPLILEAFKNPSNTIRFAAMSGASLMKLENAIPFLVDLLQEKSEGVRKKAFEALQKFNGSSFLPFLHDLLLPENSNPIALEVLQLISEKSDDSSLQPLRQYARTLLKRKNRGERELFEETVFILNRMGDESLNNDLLEEPVKELKKNPTSYWNVYRIGNIYYRLSKYKLAISWYNKAVSVARIPNEFRSHIYTELARCYSLLGDVKKALEFLEKAQLKDYSILNEDPDFENLRKNGRFKKKTFFFLRGRFHKSGFSPNGELPIQD